MHTGPLQHRLHSHNFMTMLSADQTQIRIVQNNIKLYYLYEKFQSEAASNLSQVGLNLDPGMAALGINNLTASEQQQLAQFIISKTSSKQSLYC
jgi:hypothetical protein